MKRSLTSAFVLLGLCTGSVLAQAPRTMKAIPVFPSAAVDAAIQAQAKQRFDETTSEMSGLTRRELKVLVTTAAPDEMTRWYIGQLKAQSSTGEGFDPEILLNGGTSPVQVDLSYYQPEDFEKKSYSQKTKITIQFIEFAEEGVDENK